MHLNTYLDLSTSHITQLDGEKLESDTAGIIRYNKDEYGWFIHVHAGDNDFRDMRDSAHDAGMSEAFLNLLSTAHAAGCTLICLDRDAEQMSGLPTFDW